MTNFIFHSNVLFFYLVFMKHFNFGFLCELIFSYNYYTTAWPVMMCVSVCVCLCTRTDDRHALAVRVEVEQGQHFVGCLVIHLLDADGVLRARQKHVAEVPRGRHQGALIRRGSLVHQFTWEKGKNPYIQVMSNSVSAVLYQYTFLWIWYKWVFFRACLE